MLAACMAAGLFTGVVAGLLGIGGGLVMIPVLNTVFVLQGVDPAHVQHMALGTSLAAIVPTGLLSARAHARRGAVEWPAVRAMAGWIAAGALTSALLARFLPTVTLQCLYLLLCAWVLFTMARPPVSVAAAELPPLRGAAPAAGGIGVLSGLLGIGGGTLTTPFLLRQRRDIRVAVATASALGVPIAIAGALGYVAGGMGIAGRTATAVGFVDLAAVAGLVTGSALSTGLGVNLAHRLPRVWLRLLFALMICAAAGKMVWHMAG